MENKDRWQQLLTVVLLGAAVTTSAAAAQQANHVWGSGPKWGAGANTSASQPSDTKETQVLLNHDELLPTLNRTYAMRYEAENGHLWPDADQQIKPYLPKAKPAQQPIKQSRRQSVDKVHPHVPHQLTQRYK
jgi:hypothetical protein